jgi:DnaJ-class molecular chaperone
MNHFREAKREIERLETQRMKLNKYPDLYKHMLADVNDEIQEWRAHIEDIKEYTCIKCKGSGKRGLLLECKTCKGAGHIAHLLRR